MKIKTKISSVGNSQQGRIPDVDRPEYYKENSTIVFPGNLLTAKKTYKHLFNINKETLEEFKKGESALVLKALKNTKSNEEAVLLLYKEAKYLFIIPSEQLTENFIFKVE